MVGAGEDRLNFWNGRKVAETVGYGCEASRQGWNSRKMVETFLREKHEDMVETVEWLKIKRSKMVENVLSGKNMKIWLKRSKMVKPTEHGWK